jgi:DNA mismatch endonuclease (patch repair protein)
LDTFKPAKRSEIMTAIHSKDTKPELIVRHLLHGLGYRYHIHPKEIPGKPDIFFVRRKKDIFVNGCFWHGHSACKRSSRPSSNVEFWQNKIETNIERDRENLRKLKLQGISSFVVWQCQLKDTKKLTQRLTQFLGKPRHG